MLRIPRNIHQSLPVAAVLATALGLTACGSSGSKTPAPTPAATVSSADVSSSTASAAATPSVPTTPTSSVAAQSSGAAAGPPCAESQLKASTTDAVLNAGGQRGVRVLFLNTSTSTCTLTGYPGAAIVDASGRQIKQATRTLRGPLGGMPVGDATYTPVSLAPGASAQAELEGANTRQVGAAQAGCDDPAYPSILVTPPNTTIPVPFTVTWPICESFEVHPVRPVPS